MGKIYKAGKFFPCNSHALYLTIKHPPAQAELCSGKAGDVGHGHPVQGCGSDAAIQLVLREGRQIIAVMGQGGTDGAAAGFHHDILPQGDVDDLLGGEEGPAHHLDGLGASLPFGYAAALNSAVAQGLGNLLRCLSGHGGYIGGHGDLTGLPDNLGGGVVVVFAQLGQGLEGGDEADPRGAGGRKKNINVLDGRHIAKLVPETENLAGQSAPLGFPRLGD